MPLLSIELGSANMPSVKTYIKYTSRAKRDPFLVTIAFTIFPLISEIEMLKKVLRTKSK